MILRSEINRIAREQGVPPSTIDKDWVLGHVLAALFRQDWAREMLLFKINGFCYGIHYEKASTRYRKEKLLSGLAEYLCTIGYPSYIFPKNRIDLLILIEC